MSALADALDGAATRARARARCASSSTRARARRAELAKPRSGYDDAGRRRLRRDGGLAAAPRPGRAAAPTPSAIDERAWLRRAAAIVEALGRRPAARRPRGRARSAATSRSRWATGDPELAVLAFDEAVARRRPAARARRARPAALLERRATGARRSARRTRCASPRPSPASAATRPTPTPVEQHEEAVLALLERHGAASRARTTTPTRPAASPAGSSSASTAWGSGAATTPTSPTSRAASPATTARSPSDVGEALLRGRPARREAERRPAPRLPQPAPRRRRSARLIDDGDAPAGSELPRT